MRRGSPEILWENTNLIAIDKPEGLLSMARDGSRDRNALDFVSEYLRRRGNARSRAALVHRLDRDTSGILLFAKNAAAKRKMMALWNENVSEKTYTALVEGKTDTEGVIDIWLVEGKDLTVRPASPNSRGALKARTTWTTIRSTSRYSLVSVTIDTGRKHQIRAHFTAIGHPVAGDSRYGAKSDPLHRLALHASLLSFTEPFTGELITIKAKYPETFMRAVDFP